MEQHNIDNDFRNKLNQREIKPSENAWDRLDAMLAVGEEKKPKRSYGWLYVAASFIGFLLIATVFFSPQEMIDIRRNPVVIENNNPKPVEKETVVTKDTLPQSQQSTAIALVSNQPHKEIKVKSKNPINNQTPEIINPTPKNPELIANNIINQKTEQQTTTVKVDELLALVVPTPTGNAKPSVKVNAKNLLSQVDGEVNLSFREKMLRTARRNYQEVAEAVSTRNTQQ